MKSSAQIYPTKDYLSVEHALDSMASEEAFKSNVPGAAAFACAGPVLDNKCVMTNLSWVIDGQSLTIKYGIRYTGASNGTDHHAAHALDHLTATCNTCHIS